MLRTTVGAKAGRLASLLTSRVGVRKLAALPLAGWLRNLRASSRAAELRWRAERHESFSPTYSEELRWAAEQTEGRRRT